MSADISDLPDLVDVSAESASLNDSGLNKSTASSKHEEEGEFRPVISKRKRRQDKMEVESSKSKKSSSLEIEEDDEEDDDEVDMEELEEILEEKPEDNQPLKKIKFPPISNEKLAVRSLIYN